MKEQKNIDRLFQEKFKDFEAMPPESVWSNIKRELKKEDEKKPFIIPLWYKIAGVAALFALLFWLGKPLLNDSTINTNVVEAEKDDNPNKNEVENDNTESNAEKELRFGNSESAEERSNITSKNAIVSTEADNVNRAENASAVNTKDSQNNTLAERVNNGSTNRTEVTLNNISNTNKEKRTYKNSALNPKETFNNAQQNSKEEIAISSSNPNREKEEEIISRFQQSTSNDTNKLESVTSSTNSNISSEKENKETTKVAEPFLNPITEAEAIADNTKNYSKWEVGPYAAPIYYDGLGNGSTVDEKFSDNATENNVSLAYGVNVAYSISKRLKIRSGVSKVNHSINTNGVSFGATSSPVAIKNIRQTSSDGLFVNIIDTPGTSSQPDLVPTTELTGRSASTFFEGAINQTLGYIEIPLELEYAIINKRIGVSLIGGASTLFLDENTISVEVSGVRNEIGEASNVNDVSYSTNIGLGINYKITKAIDFNLEPTFKYQINTFSDSNNFNPYTLGLNTGFSVKF